MTSSNPTDSTQRIGANHALAVYFAELCVARRVCVVGDALDSLVEVLRRTATRVDVAVNMPSGKYDVVFVPDVLAEPFNEAGGIAVLQNHLTSDGAVVLATRADGELQYEEFFDLVSASFAHVTMAGQAAFAGYSVVDFDADPEAGIVFDGSLLGEATESLQNFVAIASSSELRLGGYTVVQVPSAHAATARVAARQEPGLNKAELERAEAEVGRLEAALQEQARELRESRAEAERRGILARDLVEEMAELRKSAGSVVEIAAAPVPLAAVTPPESISIQSARDRVLVAEVRSTEAAFRANELAAQLAAEKSLAQQKADKLRAKEGELSDSLRAVSARSSELEEMHTSVQGRLTLAERDLELARDQIRSLERELAEARDEVELEIARRHSESAGLKQVRSTLDELASSVRDAIDATAPSDDD